MLFHRILGLFSNDLAIDLGTANTLVYKLTGRNPGNENMSPALSTVRITRRIFRW
ncbi:MAG TPA: hypothetical protein VMH06_03500 [Thermodesulfovibrionales bacterium]|nr:hypothetical protein [Thermodesulfovibrionales bacterium]